MGPNNTIPRGTADSVKYTESSYYDGRNGESGTVYVYSNTFVSPWTGNFAKYHYILFDGGGDMRVVFECGGDIDSESFYACRRVNGSRCRDLGQHRLSDVYHAAQNASATPNSMSYNRNHWTEAVARGLGRRVTLNYDCSCGY